MKKEILVNDGGIAWVTYRDELAAALKKGGWYVDGGDGFCDFVIEPDDDHGEAYTALCEDTTLLRSSDEWTLKDTDHDMESFDFCPGIGKSTWSAPKGLLA